MEIWDLYNKHRELVGLNHARGEEIPKGYYHLVVHVWIQNIKGEYLISQRSANRPTFPLKWECVGGSAIKGEKSLDAALRETREEVGILLSPEKEKRIHSVVGRIVNGTQFPDILDVWLFKYDGDVTLEKALTDEVMQTFWMTQNQIKDIFDSGNMVPTLEYFFKIIGK